MGCSKAGDFSTASKSAADLLTIVSPTLTTKSAQQTTASKIVVGSALSGDIIRFSTSGSCTGTGNEIEDETVITAGSVMTSANLNAGSVTACFATKEDPTAFTNIGTITVNAKSLIVEYVLTLKKADGSEMTYAEIKSESWYAEWETEIAAQFATENGLKAGSVVVESITQGSLIIKITGTSTIAPTVVMGAVIAMLA